MAAATAVLLLAAPQALAAQPGTGAARPGAAQSCVLRAVPDPATGTRAAATTVSCFAGLADAIAYVTGGAVRLPADTTVVGEADLARAGGDEPAGNTVLGVEYKNRDFGGSTLVLTWPGAVSCAAGRTFSFPSMGALGWGDRISSAKAYAGCQSDHFADAGFRGRNLACTCPSMGAMNDHTSSIRFH